MHNGLPRCKALLFPLVRGRLEYFKKNTTEANVTLVNRLLSLCREKREKPFTTTQQLTPLAFSSRLKGSFCPRLPGGLRGLPLPSPSQRLSLVPKRLCTAGACLIFPSGAGGECRRLLERCEGQCHLSGSLPSVIE